MHSIQKILLKRLLVNNGQKYSTLTQGYNYEDNIVFHLKQLQNSGLILKSESNYSITTKGTKEITKFDLNSLEDTGFKTFFLGFVCKNDKEYLLKEHSSKNEAFYNLPSGKPMFGENINDALIRAFYENTGLKLESDNFKYLSLHLKTIKTSSGEVLFDDAFAIYEILISDSQKTDMNLGKNIKWFSKNDVEKMKNCWPEVDFIILKDDKTNYRSYQFVSDYII